MSKSKQLDEIVSIIEAYAETGHKFAKVILGRMEQDKPLTRLEQMSIKKMIDDYEAVVA